MSILPHDALAVDVYPDEAPELPISAYFEPADASVLDAAEASDPATWPDWVDDDCWALGPMPEHGRPLPGRPLPGVEPIPAACVCRECAASRVQAPHEALAAQVAAEARKHRRLDTPLHDMIADELLSLAHNIRRVQAATPIEYEARMEIVDRDLIADAEERGYDAGYSAGLAASF